MLCCAVCGREKEAKRHMARWHNSFFSFYFIVLPGRACARLEMGKGKGELLHASRCELKA